MMLLCCLGNGNLIFKYLSLSVRYFEMNVDMGIVLTGTIKPNSNFVAVKSVSERRKQYLEAIKYYCKFCPVWFLENSEYDIESDNDFKK